MCRDGDFFFLKEKYCNFRGSLNNKKIKNASLSLNFTEFTDISLHLKHRAIPNSGKFS